MHRTLTRTAVLSTNPTGWEPAHCQELFDFSLGDERTVRIHLTNGKVPRPLAAGGQKLVPIYSNGGEAGPPAYVCDGVNAEQVSGSLLMMVPGATPPAGYVFVGTFREEQVDPDGPGGVGAGLLRIAMWRKP